MVIDMNEAQVRTLDQVRQVVAGTAELEFKRADNDEGRYGWIGSVCSASGTAASNALIEACCWCTCSA